MYSVRGFILIPDAIQNAPGVLSPYGELSNNALSFSREKGVYSSETFTNVKLVAFSALSGESEDSVPSAISQSFIDSAIMPVASYIATAIANEEITDDAGALSLAITSKFSFISSLELGEIKQIISGTFESYCPEWVNFVTADGDTIRVWFMDESFQSQYDQYDIVVVPPFANLNNFFLAGSQVDSRLSNLTVTDLVDSIQEAKNSNPETIVAVKEYEYINPSKTTNYVKAKFGVLVYGNAGNNEDSIRDAIGQYLIDNSTHTRSEWAEILPDIFKRSEFVFIPSWDSYAIEARTLEAGIYSPFNDLAVSVNRIHSFLTDYEFDYIAANAISWTHTYRSVNVLSIGSAENRNGITRISDLYTDFISVSTSSTDFNRMSDATQKFALVLDRLIQLAESITAYSVLPVGYSKIRRNDITYVCRTVDNYLMLVPAKFSKSVMPL